MLGGAVDYLKTVDWDLLSSYAGLLGLALFSIYAGAHGSLPVSLIFIFFFSMEFIVVDLFS